MPYNKLVKENRKNELRILSRYLPPSNWALLARLSQKNRNIWQPRLNVLKSIAKPHPFSTNGIFRNVTWERWLDRRRLICFLFTQERKVNGHTEHIQYTARSFDTSNQALLTRYNITSQILVQKIFSVKRHVLKNGTAIPRFKLVSTQKILPTREPLVLNHGSTPKYLDMIILHKWLAWN